VLDDLRVGALHIRGRRRLKLIEFLSTIGHAAGNPAMALISGDGSHPAGSQDAESARLTLNQAMRFLHARRLLREIFSPKVMKQVLRAIEKNSGQKGDSRE
jgi:hypothetical protein